MVGHRFNWLQLASKYPYAFFSNSLKSRTRFGSVTQYVVYFWMMTCTFFPQCSNLWISHFIFCYVAIKMCTKKTEPILAKELFRINTMKWFLITVKINWFLVNVSIIIAFHNNGRRCCNADIYLNQPNWIQQNDWNRCTCEWNRYINKKTI